MKYDIKILPKTNDSLFLERETLETHSAFKLELRLLESIKNGDQKELKKALDNYINEGFVLGLMSENKELEIKYWAVSTISLATHYAILGGLDETDAYNLSDKYINNIDKLKTFDEMLKYLSLRSFELCKKVKESKAFSNKIRKCTHYIHIHLHEKITIDDLADYTSLSKDYLSVLFKKETGYAIHEYIIKEKLKESINMMDKMNFKDIAYTLAFCSQTHYISLFKKEYGITPKEYKEKKL